MLDEPRSLGRVSTGLPHATDRMGEDAGKVPCLRGVTARSENHNSDSNQRFTKVYIIDSSK